MKIKILIPLFIVLIGFATTSLIRTNNLGMKAGNPEIKSINALSFSPEGVLFIGDSKSASVIAMETDDKARTSELENITLRNLDQRIAESLGTAASDIFIQDMAVHPLSKAIYFAVHAGDGTPVLLRFENDEFKSIELKDVKHSKVSLNNAVAEDAKDRRGRSLRVWAISDLSFASGNVMVTGLSNQEFSSTFRKIPFPFKDNQQQTSLEIYHAAHGRYETHSPVKTFTTASINGKDYLLASYTCTPLVLFPLDDLKDGEHNKGRTVAEFGNGNTPLDMIVMEKEGKSFLIMSNSNRPVMKIKFDDIEAFSGSLTEPVDEPAATAGVDYISLPMVNVLQLDKLDENRFVILQRTSTGDLNIRTQSNWWL